MISFGGNGVPPKIFRGTVFPRVPPRLHPWVYMRLGAVANLGFVVQRVSCHRGNVWWHLLIYRYVQFFVSSDTLYRCLFSFACVQVADIFPCRRQMRRMGEAPIFFGSSTSVLCGRFAGLSSDISRFHISA